MSPHTYYYKIIDSPPESPLPPSLPLSELDTKDGFIHLSTAQQTPITADLFFKAFSKLWILKIRVKDLDGEIRFPDDLPGCPHLHNSKVGLGEGSVESVIVVEKTNAGMEWKEVEELMKLED